MNARVAIPGLCLAIAACQSPSRMTGPFDDPPPQNYFEARWNDFKQALSVRVGVGPGLGARVAVTKAVQAGLMYVGPAEPYGELLKLKSLYVGNVREETAIWDVRSSEYGLSVLYHYEDDVVGYRPLEAAWRGSYQERSALALDAGLHLGLVGAQLTFDPWAFVKFFGGVLGFGEAGWSSIGDPTESDLG